MWQPVWQKNKVKTGKNMILIRCDMPGQICENVLIDRRFSFSFRLKILWGLVSATATTGDVETFSTAGSLTKHAPKIPVSRGSKSAGKVRCKKEKEERKERGRKKTVDTPRKDVSDLKPCVEHFKTGCCIYKQEVCCRYFSRIYVFFIIISRKKAGKIRFSYRFTRSS